jgi:hypothetical protein
MMDGFSAADWHKLTNKQRIEHCVMAAREAESFAQMAKPELRKIYIQLAEQWRALADEIEHSEPGG